MNYHIVTSQNFKKVPLPGLNAWLDALRSGNYTQTKDYLATANNGQWSYCCLGVLCDVEERPSTLTMENSHLCFDRHVAGLTHHIRQFPVLGESGQLPDGCYVFCDKTTRQLKLLTELNDLGFSFSEIADIIEELFTEEK
jgi:hypothetical protein